jgi:hypothetical protein
MTCEQTLGEMAREFIDQKQERVYQWEQGTPLQQMLARNLHNAAEVD